MKRFIAYEHTEGLCGKCLQQVIIRRQKLKFWLNLLLTIATVGIWAFFWYKNAKRLDKQWRCTRCGSEVFRLIEYRF
jgi:ribosomal protein S27AE